MLEPIRDNRRVQAKQKPSPAPTKHTSAGELKLEMCFAMLHRIDSTVLVFRPRGTKFSRDRGFRQSAPASECAAERA